jgi:glycosyltransferase involved in cell wall biosynthesis
MHENQLTYPLPADPTTGPMRRQLGERDLHYAFINYASMLAADRVFFNSQYHLESFFEALPNFLRHYPEYNELNTIRTLRAKSQVLHVGLELDWLIQEQPDRSSTSHVPLVLWNQRWEYDKNPAAFFEALDHLVAEGIPFRLALCGQQFGRQPSAFAAAIERLGGHLVHIGYANPTRYRQLLREAAVTVSTAEHEFFGISILEAIAAETFPILPDRLSYPELIPTPFHGHCLYENNRQLLDRLRWALTQPAEAEPIARQLAKAVERFSWQHLAPRYDASLLALKPKPG